MSDLPTIPGYDVVELIDVGGFSRVYRGIQLSIDRPVAIKVLNAPFHDERQRRAFERECRVMGQLSTHPHIVTVYDSAIATHGDGPGLPAIVMELYVGTYRGAGRLSIPEVVDVGIKIADALAHVHRQGIVHRDLKPHNLFRSQHGEPAIADFGISTFGGAGEHTTGARFTLKYAPPELLREGASGATGDVYSLGATLYQLAAGRVPFDGDDEAEIVRQVMVADPPALGRSDAPPDLDRLIARCLAKHPSGRPPSASQVADELRRIRAVAGVGAPHHRVAVPAPLGDVAEPPTDAAPAGHGDHTVVRDPHPADLAAAAPGAGAAEPAPGPPANRRAALIGGAVAVLAIAVAALAIVLTSGGDAADGSVPTTSRPAATGAGFEVLTAPDQLTVVRTEAGYEFTFAVPAEGQKVRIHWLGTDANRIAAGSPFLWATPEPPAEGACFEARTVNAAETRMSQVAAGPVCA